MLVSAVEPRKKGLSALYIDGEYTMKLDTEVLIESRIAPGTELDDDALHELIGRSDARRAKNKAMWLISYRDHSSGELYDKLRRDFGDDASRAAVVRLIELGLINDEAFALRYATELYTVRCLSEDGIIRKLREKGIDKDMCAAVVDSLGIDPKEQIQRLIEKKYTRYLSDEKGLKKTAAALARAGYSWRDIRDALRIFSGESGE